MQPQDRRRYYNQCHPEDTLDPGDQRYVDVDAIDRAHPVRGYDWVERLAERIELSDRPVYELFTGLPGTGKSTELRRLKQRLQAKSQLLPILISAEDALDLSNPIDIPDIYFAILHYTDAQLLELEGQRGIPPMHEGFLRRFWNWVTTTDVRLKEAQFAVADAGRLVVELKDRPSLRTQVRASVAAHLPRFLDDAHEELRALEDRALKLGFSGLVVIFDSLEKLRGTSTNWGVVMESAERIFGGNASYLRLPIHALYTIPTALIVRLKLDSVHFLPMIKLRNRDGSRFEPGVEAAYLLIAQRVPLDALREVFGEQRDERIERLVDWSGGYPREIVRLLQLYLGTAMEKWPLPDSDFERILNEVADGYHKLVRTNSYAWLAQVASRQELVLEDDTDREIADRLLQNNAVLRYLNDREWFDLHPAVRRIPGVSEQIARMAAGPSQGA